MVVDGYDIFGLVISNPGFTPPFGPHTYHDPLPCVTAGAVVKPRARATLQLPPLSRASNANLPT
jgi:hypothetical protein